MSVLSAFLSYFYIEENGFALFIAELDAITESSSSLF